MADGDHLQRPVGDLTRHFQNEHSLAGLERGVEGWRGADLAEGASASLVHWLPASGPRKRRCKSPSEKAAYSPRKES